MEIWGSAQEKQKKRPPTCTNIQTVQPGPGPACDFTVSARLAIVQSHERERRIRACDGTRQLTHTPREEHLPREGDCKEDQLCFGAIYLTKSKDTTARSYTGALFRKIQVHEYLLPASALRLSWVLLVSLLGPAFPRWSRDTRHSPPFLLLLKIKASHTFGSQDVSVALRRRLSTFALRKGIKWAKPPFLADCGCHNTDVQPDTYAVK